MPKSVIQTPCTQVNKKVLNIRKARVLGNALVDSQFNYYTTIIWMFSKKTIYFKTQKINHRTLRIIYQSDESCENLLNLDNSAWFLPLSL